MGRGSGRVKERKDPEEPRGSIWFEEPSRSTSIRNCCRSDSLSEIQVSSVEVWIRRKVHALTS